MDSASVGFSNWRNINRFLALFYVIKMLSPDTVDFRVEVPPVRAEDLSQGRGRIDWDDLFQRLVPYRAYAVEEVCREYAISEREAQRKC